MLCDLIASFPDFIDEQHYYTVFPVPGHTPLESDILLRRYLSDVRSELGWEGQELAYMQHLSRSVLQVFLYFIRLFNFS